MDGAYETVHHMHTNPYIQKTEQKGEWERTRITLGIAILGWIVNLGVTSRKYYDWSMHLGLLASTRERHQIYSWWGSRSRFPPPEWGPQGRMLFCWSSGENSYFNVPACVWKRGNWLLTTTVFRCEMFTSLSSLRAEGAWPSRKSRGMVSIKHVQSHTPEAKETALVISIIGVEWSSMIQDTPLTNTLISD